MKKSKYQVIVKIVELGSFAQAAAFCNYSQSAVSKIVSTVESELGVTLLIRTHKGVRLTEDGAQLFPYIRGLSNTDAALYEKASELVGIESGTIKLGTFSSISSHILAPILRDFKKEHPNIKFELFEGLYSDTEKWISNGTTDLGFVYMPTMKEFTTVPMFEDRMLALLPSDHPLAALDVIPLAAFENEPFIMLSGTDREVLKAFSRKHIKPDIEYVTDNDYAIISMVENGLGLSILAELMLRDDNHDIVVRETEAKTSRKIGLAIKNKAHVSLAVNNFMDFLTDHISEYVPK